MGVAMVCWWWTELLSSLESLGVTLAVSTTCLLLMDPLTEDLRLDVTEDPSELELELDPEESEELALLLFTAVGGLLS